MAIYCSHMISHIIKPPAHEGEMAFRMFLDQKGWTYAGYCYAYYPEWLKVPFSRWLLGES